MIRREKQCPPEVRTTQIDVFLSALLETGTTRTVRTSPLEWVAATGIYITHVVDNIERNKSNLRMRVVIRKGGCHGQQSVNVVSAA
jgi:hypothetical protein